MKKNSANRCQSKWNLLQLKLTRISKLKKQVKVTKGKNHLQIIESQVKLTMKRNY